MTSVLDTVSTTPLVYIAILVCAALYVLRDPAMIASIRDLLSLADTNGGHILMLCMYVWFGWHMFATDQTAGGQIITGAWSALLVLLNVRRTQAPGTTSVETTTTPPSVTSPPTPAATTAVSIETQTAPPVAPMIPVAVVPEPTGGA